VLGSDTRSFLAVVRSLGRRQLAVHVGWCPPGEPALRSRYIAKVHTLPTYAPDAEWKGALIALLQREQFDLVIPCDDPTLLPLQLHREDLERAGRLYLLNQQAFHVTTSKFATTALAREHDVPVPREFTASRIRDAEEVLARLEPPFVLKPGSSFTMTDLTTRRRVRKAGTPDELRDGLAELLATGPVQVQEHFTGVGVGVEVLAGDGDVLYAFQHLRIHEPPAGGGSSYRKSVPLTPDLLAAARQLIKALDYTGVAMFEFKVHPRTGAWILVEINGRFWGSLPLAVAAGADFPYYLYQMLVEGRRDFSPGYREGLFARNWRNDVGWAWLNFTADRADPGLVPRSLWQVAGEVVNVLTVRERSDTFVLDDPGPAFAELAGIVRWVLGEGQRWVRRRPRFSSPRPARETDRQLQER